MKKLVFATAFALAVAACANTTTVPRPVPHYTYTQYPPVMLNVASIQVIDYTSPMQAPNVEHLMPQPLPSAVGDWARTHFKAAGVDGTAFITVRDASMVGQDLSRTQGLKGMVTIDQAEKYAAHISVEFKVEGKTSGTSGNGGVKVERSSTVAENASLQDRDRIWTTMEENMLVDLDAATMQMLQNRLPFLVLKN